MLSMYVVCSVMYILYKAVHYHWSALFGLIKYFLRWTIVIITATFKLLSADSPRSDLSKNHKIIPVGGNRTCGQGINCQDCDKNSRQLALFFEKMAAWMEFRLRKGFTGSRSLLPKNEPSYGSVRIKLSEIIAATLRHLSSHWKGSCRITDSSERKLYGCG